MPANEPTVADVGEAAVLRQLLAQLPSSPHIPVGPGDDAAVLAPAQQLVVTTDTLVDGPDFRLAWSSGSDLGYKAAAVNLADVAAMGAEPTALVIALMLPPETPVAFVVDLARGTAEACAELAPGCVVVGGDLAASDTLAVAVTAMGDLGGTAPVLRSGASAGDVVAIAGVQGDAVRGLRLLFERFATADGQALAYRPEQLTAEERALVSAQLRPRPPLAAGPIAARAGATAMMDVSDGLVLDARRMAVASGVTIALDAAALGEHPAAALDGGEDHALLATFPAEVDVPQPFRVIGRVCEAGEADVLVDGVPRTGRGGWDPYQDWADAGS